ncbi:MAG: hypothetical protein RIT23_842, partial [Actinomycetota bacterium]
MKIKEENQTLATITLQNYFRMYDKLAGMTGTASTEAAELVNTYGLQVVPIPTNRPRVRADQADLIYKSEDAKFRAVVADIQEKHAKGQPILVGTVSVEKSELLSRKLQQVGVRHEERHAGVSNYSFYRLVRLNFDLITGFSLAPLQVFTMFALACSAGSFLLVLILDALTPNKRITSVAAVYFGLCLGLVAALAFGSLLDTIADS